MSGTRLDADDPVMRSILLDLFTDIAILEHLTRQRFDNHTGELDPRQFGVLNYLVRSNRDSERVDLLAWSFQVELAAMLESVEVLAGKALVEIDWVDGKRRIFLTAKGRGRHAQFLDSVAPDVAELIAELDPEALRITAETLKELRRTFDNMPDR